MADLVDAGCGVKIGEPVLTLFNDRIEVISYARIYSQSWRHPPIVLEESPERIHGDMARGVADEDASAGFSGSEASARQTRDKIFQRSAVTTTRQAPAVR